MSEPESPKQQPDNPLPDPSDRPVKAATSLAPAFEIAATITGTVLACGAALLILIANIRTPTMGGRRSTQLKWQEQQRQTDDAISKDAMNKDVMKKGEAATSERPAQSQHE